MKDTLNKGRTWIINIHNAYSRFRGCPDTESEQALIRVVVILAIILYLNLAGAYVIAAGNAFLFFSWLAFVNALLIVVWIFFQPFQLISRRIYSLFSDNAFVSMLMLFGEEKAIVLFTVYIWVTIGYGFRYGVKYLYLSMFASVVFFGSLIILTEYWGDAAITFSIGVLLSLVIIPLYTTKLIHDLRTAIALADKASRAKDRFLATVSHEMRTPLNGIKGYIDLIRKEELSEKVRGYLEPVILSANNLENDINNILDFSKMEAGKMTTTSEPVDLKYTFESEVNVLKPLAERKGLVLNMSIDPGLPDMVSTDESAVRKIVQNLVANSIKFTTQGNVSVNVTALLQGDRDFIVRLVVRDSGIGIPPESIAHVFTPFTQLDSGANRKYEGTGLGLNNTQEFVGKLGGHIAVDSKPGEYTEITVELPVTALDGGEILTPKSGTGEVSIDAAGVRALVVDDNEINRSLLQAFLESLNFRVDTANSGKLAIQMFNRTVYQIVFIDIHMPGMDGIETINNLTVLDVAKIPPMVAVTADVIGLRNGDFGEADFDAVLIKPIDEHSLRKLAVRYFPEFESGESTATSNYGMEEKQTDILDRNRGLELASGSEKLWRGNVSRFLGMLPEQIEQIQEAITVQDWTKVEEVAHHIKGSTQYIGANSLCRCIEQLEEFARQGSVSGYPDQLELLKEEYRKLKSAFNSLLD